jgi:hypothetical protein
VQAVRVDQELRLVARHALRDVVEDHLGPAEVREQAVAGGELEPQRPFLGADAGRTGGLRKLTDRCVHRMSFRDRECRL